MTLIAKSLLLLLIAAPVFGQQAQPTRRLPAHCRLSLDANIFSMTDDELATTARETLECATLPYLSKDDRGAFNIRAYFLGVQIASRNYEQMRAQSEETITSLKRQLESEQAEHLALQKSYQDLTAQNDAILGAMAFQRTLPAPIPIINVQPAPVIIKTNPQNIHCTVWTSTIDCY